MFGKKQDNLLPESSITVNTIPDDFYGGKNPVVNFKNVLSEVDFKKDKTEKLTPQEKKIFFTKTAAGAEGDWHLTNLFTNSKFLAVFAGLIFFATILIFGGYYYWKNYFNVQQPEVSDNGFIDITVLPTTTIENNLINSSSVEIPVISEPQTTTLEVVIKELPLDFPSTLLAESADLDEDGLTDLAEEEFQTDPGDFDTDKDKYPDGVEIFNLYNPKGFEPQKLIDSGLVKSYENPNFGYRLQIPIHWAIGSVDEEERQILFSTLSGENIEVRVSDLKEGEDFNAWFTRMALNQDFTALKDFETRSKYLGKVRDDGLVYYFVYNNKVYVLLYHTTDSSIVNYKSVFALLARSFDFQINNQTVLEDQVKLINTLSTTTENSEE
ncbi:MAG TPA: hypothetical protein P5230_03680 [Candidatus Magasanikbacteria bacterium]|nr:hypothetical protein [Candidatus Magasanikbacteria bacterium]